MRITQHRLHRLLLVILVLVTSQLISAAVRRREYKKTKCLNPPRTARRVENVIAQCQEEVKNKLVGEALQIMRQELAQKEKTEKDNLHKTIVFTTEKQPPSQQSQQAWGDYQQIDEEKKQEEEDEDEYEENYDDYEEVTTTTKSKIAFLPTIPAKSTRPARSPISIKPTRSIRRRMSRLLHAHRIDRIDEISGSLYTPTIVTLEDKRIAGCLLHCVYAKNNAIDTLGWPTLDGLVDFYSEGVSEHGFFMATLRSVNLCLRAVTRKYHVDRRRLPEGGESCDLAFDVFDCISDQITDYCFDEYRQ